MEITTLIKAIKQDSELQQIAQQLLNVYKLNLTHMNAIASGNLREQAEVEIFAEEGHIELYFMLMDYWQFLENGPKPHWPPIKPIEQWIIQKGIKPVPRAGQKKAPSVKQLAYMIARSMAKGKKDIDGQMKAYLSRPAIRYMLEDNEALVNRFIERINEIYIENFQEITESFYTIGPDSNSQ